jgi:cytoskeleton protein RodZ
MTESGAGPGAVAAVESSDGSGPRTAGALLKAARQREKLHLAVLAATIKVTPAKLEALEQDRYDQLPNPTFTRALAQSVCRSLKIDPRPVLALLPQVEMAALEGSLGRLNTPFQERPSRTDGGGLAWATKPMFWAGGLLLVAAVVVALLPPDLVTRWSVSLPGTDVAPAPVASSVTLAVAPAAAAGSTPAAAGSDGPASSAAATTPTAVPLAASAVPVPVAVAADATAVPALVPNVTTASTASVAASAEPAGSAAAAGRLKDLAVGPGLLRLTASADSWIEVIDAGGQAVFSRILQRGETVALDPRPPLRVRVGNASGTQVAFRGQAFDLAPHTRDNVARVELR